MTWPTLTVSIGTAPGLEPAGWTDVSDRLIGQAIVDYGRPSELAQDVTGVGSLVLDNDDGTWGAGIAPGTAVKITATLSATTYPVLYGLIESAPTQWPHDGLDAVVDVRVADGMTLLARYDDDSVTRPQELSGTRIAALLDLAGWPSGMRDIDAGVVLVDAIDDEPVNILSAIRDAVDAEQGQMFVAPDGDFTFRDRHDRLDAVSAATFGAGGIEYEGLVAKYDDATLWTVGRTELANGDVFEYEDTAQVAVYGRRVFPVRDVPVADAEAEGIAMWMVLRYSEPARRFERLEAQIGDDAAMVSTLTLRPGHKVRVTSETPGAWAAVDEYVYIEKVTHTLSVHSWRSMFHLSPNFYDGPFLTLAANTGTEAGAQLDAGNLLAP